MEELIKKCSDSQLDEIIKMVNKEKDLRMQSKIEEFKDIFKNLIKEAWSNGVCIKIENFWSDDDDLYIYNTDDLIICRADDNEMIDYYDNN